MPFDHDSRLGEICRSQALLAEAEELANLGSWEHDLLTGTVFQSENLRRMLATDAGENVPKDDVWRFVDPRDRSKIREIIDGATRARKPYEFQVRFVFPDGRRKVLLVRGKPIMNSENRVVKRVGVAMDITDRVESAAAIRESEEKYRDLVENSNALICTHDLDGQLLSMNELPARILGFTPQELVGKRIPDLLPVSGAELYAGYVARIKRDGHATGLMVLRTRSGDRRVWEYQNTLRTGGVTKPIVRGTAYDITERFEAQEKLRKSETLLAQAELLANLGSWELEVETKKVHWSENFYRLFGLKPGSEPLTSCIGIDMIHPDDRARALQDAASLTSGGDEFDNELRFVAADGRERILHSRAVAVADKSGRVVCVRGMSQDVTERKREERRLRKSEDLLSQAEQMANCGSWEINLKTRKATLSKNLLQMLGLKSEAEYGRSTYWDRVHPEDRERAGKIIEEAIANVKPFEHVSRYFAQDGQLRFHYARGIPVAGPDGKAEVFIGAVQDITERVQAEKDLRSLLRKLLSVRDEDRRRLARQLHESVGQTLAALTMSMGRLQEALPGCDTPAHALWRSCQDLAREAARETREICYSMHPHMLDEAGLVPALRCYARDFAELSGIDVEVVMPEGLTRPSREIETTVFRIVQEALTNVHRHSGSRKATIRLSCDDKRLCVEVRDDGRGLPETHSALAQEFPCGVGITGMRERAEQMNGVFELESTPGRGTTIRVTLPLTGVLQA